MGKKSKDSSVFPYWIVTAFAIILVIFCLFTFLNAKKSESSAAESFDQVKDLMNETDSEADTIFDKIADIEFETDIVNEEYDVLYKNITGVQK